MSISDLVLFAALNFSRGNIGAAGFSGEPFQYIGPGQFIAYAIDTARDVAHGSAVPRWGSAPPLY